MPAISWILFSEKVVGRHSPAYVDVDNRPLRQIVQLHGWDPDDPNFEGLHHFPAGLYTDDITEEHSGNGVSIHNKLHVIGDVTVDGDVTFTGGKFAFVSTDDFTINLATHTLYLSGGDFHLSNGVFFGDINIGRIITSLTIGNNVGDPPGAINALLQVDENGTIDVNSIHDAGIRFLNLKTEAVNYAPGRVWTEHNIGGHRWITFDPTPGAMVEYLWTDSRKLTFTKGTGSQLVIDGTAAGDGLVQANVIAEFHDLVKLFYDLTGGRTLQYGAASSGGTGKRLVIVDN